MKRGSTLYRIFCYIFVGLYYVTQYNHQIAYADQIAEIKTISEMEPRSSPINIEIFELEDKKNLQRTSVYNTTLTCFTKPFGDKYGRSTNVHETVHGINNALSNAKKGYRGFYCGSGMALWIKEPDISMTDIIPHIPDVLKEYRYTLYFVKQLKHWNQVSLYPVDEWSAYICGAECAVDDYKQEIFNETKADSVSGALEFSIYCTALAKAVKINNKEYWENYPQFKNAIKFFLVKSEKVFFDGKDIFPSERQNKLLKNLQNHEKAKPIRNFLLKEFNGVFIE